MPRTSSVHYIAPSSIAITPNANGSANDLAVYIARGATIKVYSKGIAELATENGAYREWTLTGRNRRLADSAVRYTIYARLPKDNTTGGYLVFAPQTLRDGVWVDKYSSVTQSGYSVLYTDNGFDVQLIDADYQGVWHIDLHNTSKIPAVVKAGDKIAQFVMYRTEYPDVEVVPESELFAGVESERGEGAFGSTGEK